MVVSLLGRASLRFFRRHPWQGWLTLLGISIGVAVPVAVDLANSSAQRGFALSQALLVGDATHRLEGGPAGVPEQVYQRLRTELGVEIARPLIRGKVQIGEQDYDLLGIDPLAQLSRGADASKPAPGDILAPQQSAVASSFGQLSQRQLTALLTRSNSLVLNNNLAAALDLEPGDSVLLSTAGSSRQMEVAALFEGAGTETLLVADIAVAQEVLNRLGRIDSIELALAPEQADRLQAWLRPPLRLANLTDERIQSQELSRAFHTNLSAMSLLALLMGAFLIYNTLTFAVLRRREQFGTLRALGLLKAELLWLVLGEALVLGAIATLAGLAGGIALASLLLDLVTGTIDDLYYRLEVTRLVLSPWSLGKGAMLGLGFSLLAALLPAWEAGQVQPASSQKRSGIERMEPRKNRFRLVAALLLLLAGWLLLYWPSAGLIGGFVALGAMLLGFSLLVPGLTLWLTRLSGHLPGAGAFLNRLALRNIGANLSRTGPAVTALCIALATTLGVGIMIASFRATLVTWLDQSFSGDLYLSQSAANHSTDALQPLLAMLEQHPAVADVWTSRFTSIHSNQGELRLLAMSSDVRHGRGFNLKAGDSTGVRAAFAAGKGLLVSEPLAYRRGLKPGDSLELHTPRGPLALPILGIFYDYTTGPGLVILPQQLYRQWWQDEIIDGVGLMKEPTVETEDFVNQIEALVAHSELPLRLRTHTQIKAVSLRVFDRTFLITQVLRLLTLLVAFIGVFCALTALLLERRAEFTLLRAAGMTAGQIAGLILRQSLFMGALAAVLAWPLGLLMAQLLIEVINPRSFGWSMQWSLPPALLAQSLALALGAALLAALLPAWQAARMPIAARLREES